jgi:transcriptional regulator with XRE-family HTH domain
MITYHMWHMRKITPVSRAESHLSDEGKETLRSLGLALRAARTAKGITRQKLAERLLIGSQTLRRMEIGDPRVSFGYYLAASEHLNVPFLDTTRLLSLTSSLRHATSRAARKPADVDRFS